MAFIVFEGIDGAGKSSLIKKLCNLLEEKQLSYILSREPGGTELGEELREIVIRPQGPKPCPKAELLLYQAIRAQHVEEKIRPALEQQKWVLCDRFTASSLAFQAGGRGLDENEIIYLNQYSTSGLSPDLTILLDLSVDESEKRISKRSEAEAVSKDRFEQEKADFHERVRQHYLKQAKQKPNQWLVLDATQDANSVFEQLKKLLISRQLI